MQQGCNESSGGREARGDGFDDGGAASFAIPGIDDAWGVIFLLVSAAADGANDEVEVRQLVSGVFERGPFVIDEVIFSDP